MSKISMLGLYDNPDSAADALDALSEAGFDSNNFDVLTGTPYPEGAFGEHVPQHRLFRFPLFGAIVGLTLSVFLTSTTQIVYPLVTGGKPILSIFAMLVIMYEMTMLSAVITTVIGILLELYWNFIGILLECYWNPNRILLGNVVDAYWNSI